MNSGHSYNATFASEFLSPANLSQIQQIMTIQLIQVTENPQMPLVEWTPALLAAAEAFASQYRTVPARSDLISKSNLVFADQMLSQNETRYNETAFWRRWCAQGIPDPNNIPLPLPSERTDFTIETDGYMLSNPIGYHNFPTC